MESSVLMAQAWVEQLRALPTGLERLQQRLYSSSSSAEGLWAATILSAIGCGTIS